MLRREFIAALAAAVNRDRTDAAVKLVEKFTSSGEVSAAALLVRQDEFELIRGFGKARQDTVFLLASITKPMTATGVMLLRDRGELSLSDPVRRFIPEFAGEDRDLVTVHHLLTHTSGLPDMLPDNVELRKRHAPLSDFVAGTCKTPLLFKPGSRVKYQSMGILLAAEIAQRLTRQPFRDFLKKEVFTPLGMTQTALGLGSFKIPETAQCQVPEVSDWDWNSQYWRDFGAPWGGAHSTVADVARFLVNFQGGEPSVLKRTTAAEMIRIQTAGLNEAWGLGWMRKPGTFGNGCSSETYGHYGSTGTVAWHDPRSKITCVLLTTKPASDSRNGLLGPVSDLVSA